eukprot:TRINITY_DN11124_c1_g1_i1.p1 TRINITY_DN11124_c1_g1~~TRINITY_DN11124_c1_g1_i1.p1  ORF type:complete len:463 (+),score=33.83 TRINITY_DN11124_c1_g1_i1:132-1520(+)
MTVPDTLCAVWCANGSKVMAGPMKQTPAQVDGLKRNLKARNPSTMIVLGSNAEFYSDAVLDCLTDDSTLMQELSHCFDQVDLVAVISDPTNAEHELDGLFFQLYALYNRSDEWGARPDRDSDRILTMLSCDGPLPQLESVLDMDIFDIVELHSSLPVDVIDTLHTWREALPNNDMQWTRCSLSEKPGKHCITYCLKPSQPSWAKASELRPDIVNFVADDSPRDEQQACLDYFFDAPTYQFHAIDISAFDVPLTLPVFRTKHLRPNGAITLSPGTAVERCHISDGWEKVTVGNSCFHIRLTQLHGFNHRWNDLHRLPDDTQCVMLTLRARDLASCFCTRHHPLLQHVRMLRFSLNEETDHDIRLCKEVLQLWLGLFPKLVAATAVTRELEVPTRTQAQPLLNYNTICQHGLRLSDYGMLLRHEDLGPDLSRVLLLYIAAAVVGLRVPDVVGQVLLQAIVVLQT